MSETTRLGLPLMAENDSGKYLTFNAALAKLDKATARKKTISVSAGSVTLTDADYQENIAFVVTDASASGRHADLPTDIERVTLWVASSGNAHAIDVKVGSNAVTLTPGSSALIHTDGAGAIAALMVGVAAPITTFLALTDTPGSYSGQGKKLLRVNSAADAVEFVADPVDFGFALSDETTDITTGAGKLTWYAPYDFTLTEVIATLSDPSSSGAVQVDINVTGSSILSTKLTIDATEDTSLTAATAAVISAGSISKGNKITIDIDSAGADARGLKVWLLGTRA